MLGDPQALATPPVPQKLENPRGFSPTPILLLKVDSLRKAVFSGQKAMLAKLGSRPPEAEMPGFASP